MSTDTAEKTRDLEAAEKALVQEYGNFVLFSARTKPVAVVNTVLSAWGVDQIEASSADHVPSFNLVHGPKGVVAEVDRFYGVLPAPFDQDANLAKAGEDYFLSDELDAAYDFAATSPAAESDQDFSAEEETAEILADPDALAAIEEAQAEDPILDVFAESIDPVETAVTAGSQFDYTGLTLVQLRKGSRGWISGGYSLKRDALEKALKAADVTRSAILANQA